MTELRLAPFTLLKTLLITGLGLAMSAGWLNGAAQTFQPTPPIAVTTGSANPSEPTATPLATPSAKTTTWGKLTPLQRQALAPLGAQWSALSAQQQAKWLTLSKNFTQLPVADQVIMHSRMADWVDLSPQERNLARLNFNQFQYLAKEDKKAKWEAYQALPIEEKRLLSAGTGIPSKSAAPTIKPVEAHRQVQTPVKAMSGSPHAAATIDRKTLLPIQPTVVTPSPSPLTDTPEGPKPSSETAPS